MPEPEASIPLGDGDHISSVDVEKLYGDFLALPSNEIAFKIDRTRIDPERTFSQAAIELLQQELIVFVGARICKHWETTGRAPQSLTAVVQLQFD